MNYHRSITLFTEISHARGKVPFLQRCCKGWGGKVKFYDINHGQISACRRVSAIINKSLDNLLFIIYSRIKKKWVFSK